MIRPANIGGKAGKVDFRCDEHGGVAIDVNFSSLKTGKDLAAGGDDKVIVVPGSILAPACGCTTSFPRENGGPLTRQLAAEFDKVKGK